MGSKSTRKWPFDPPSIFTQGSNESDNEAYRKDALHGIHKHGSDCTGDVRALVYPLSAAAQGCCEAEPKKEGETPSIVQLRTCQYSMGFYLGSCPTSHITLRRPDGIPEDNLEWTNLIRVSIYPDPDSADLEVYNNSPHLTISIWSDRCDEPQVVHSWNSFRLISGRTWVIRITSSHTFAIVSCPTNRIYNALKSWSLEKYSTFQLCRSVAQELGEHRIRSQALEKEAQRAHKTRSLDSTNNDAAMTGVHPAPKTQACSPQPVVLYENNVTKVEKIKCQGKLRVRKSIRSPALHLAAKNWERETRTLRRLDHPNIVKWIDFNQKHLCIDFEYGGKDLAAFQNKTHLFKVSHNLDHVRMLIWSQTALALDYLHRKKQLIHCDVKPQNILLSDDHQSVKLCDLGSARPLQWEDPGGGTHNYIAPEYLLQGKRGLASDVWSLGITMLYVLGIIPLPFTESGDEHWIIHKLENDENEQRKMFRWLEKIRAAVARIPDQWAVLREMLDQNPRTRITTTDLLLRLANMKRDAARSVTQAGVLTC